MQIRGAGPLRPTTNTITNANRADPGRQSAPSSHTNRRAGPTDQLLRAPV